MYFIWVSNNQVYGRFQKREYHVDKTTVLSFKHNLHTNRLKKPPSFLDFWAKNIRRKMCHYDVVLVPEK